MTCGQTGLAISTKGFFSSQLQLLDDLCCAEDVDCPSEIVSQYM
jgi:hypothetical protein